MNTEQRDKPIGELANEKMDTFKIARTVLDLMHEHKHSWNGENFTLGNCWNSLLEPFLKGQSKHNAFALAMKTFGWQYLNDVHDICEEVVKHNLK